MGSIPCASMTRIAVGLFRNISKSRAASEAFETPDMVNVCVIATMPNSISPFAVSSQEMSVFEIVIFRCNGILESEALDQLRYARHGRQVIDFVQQSMLERLNRTKLTFGRSDKAISPWQMSQIRPGSASSPSAAFARR